MITSGPRSLDWVAVAAPWAAVAAMLAVLAAGCAGATSSSAPPSAAGASVPVSPTAATSAEATQSGSASAGPPAAAGFTTASAFEAFVASLDPSVRTSDVSGDWEVEFTLLDFEGEGVDYRPYLPIGGMEPWTWKVTPRCVNGPCDVDYEAFNASLGRSFPSSLTWLADRQYYTSTGITALPQAFCQDAAGNRIADSYNVRQTLDVVPQTAEASRYGASATQLIGLRLDEGMPVPGMPASCGTFTEAWGLHAVRPGA